MELSVLWPGVADVPDKPRFRSPEHAVRYAFAIEGRAIIDISTFFRDLRGGSVKLPEEVTGESSGWDRAAQCAMIMALMMRYLTVDEKSVLVARYGKALTYSMERTKLRCFCTVLNLVRGELPKIKLWYLVDVVKEWAGYGLDHTDVWWAVHYGVDDSTLRRWKYGRHYRGQHIAGIVDVLYRIEQLCYDKLLEPMIDAGLVEEPEREEMEMSLLNQ